MFEITKRALKCVCTEGMYCFSGLEQRAGRIDACAGALENSSQAFSDAAAEIKKQGVRLRLLLRDGRRYFQTLEEIAGIYLSAENRICSAGKTASLEWEDTVKTRASDIAGMKREAGGNR